jgi:hypothetical protein
MKGRPILKVRFGHGQDKILREMVGSDIVVHTSNPSYKGGRGRRIMV